MIFLNMKNTFHISLLYQNDIDGKRIFSNGKLGSLALRDIGFSEPNPGGFLCLSLPQDDENGVPFGKRMEPRAEAVKQR